MFDREMLVFSIPGFSDPVSAMTHLLGAGVFAVLGFFLVRRGRHVDASGWNWRMTGITVFVFAAVAQLAISGAYHILQPGLAPRLVMRQIDHTAIFILIAATFVPVHAILFKGWRRWLILLILFSLAATGITCQFLYFSGLPEIFWLTFYIAMGWVGVYSGYALYRRYGWAFIRPLIWGGVAYTLGGTIEFLRRPVLIEGVLGPHELLHLAVLAGLGFHFRFVFSFAGKRFKEIPSVKVLNSLENSAGDHCVDIFERDDGTFGFEECRRDAEDQRGWFSLHRYSHQVFATAEAALAQAKSRVEWMATERG
ncbi:MAG TPA: hemolysin III family protein [Burkholderiales bacterium]|nr:hemolysin III family protein [Burkholderiales bacterium]